MDTRDDKSEICRFANRLVDVAALYEQAAEKVDEPETASCLAGKAEARRKMSEVLLGRADLGGEPSGSTLPTPDSVLLKVSSALSATDDAIVATVRSADRELLAAVSDYLGHARPAGGAATAVHWLRDRLQSEVGPVVKEDATPAIQPG